VSGRVQRIPVSSEREVVLELQPLRRDVDIGAGPGKMITKNVWCRGSGLILDGRNRPIQHPNSVQERQAFQETTYRELGLI